ncbi:hypothetical protein ACN26Y_30070 [Micromonospora sp. WMMD558]|uniref:hypothetical protein n=1 Tax=unclassified Micromonospora TaxID=2617518 RepID=UPI0012B475C5|nr:hypothetical protein [Micromonospora sp. WMMC415]QGN50034.1 hypothetical protein GKC29_26575 [Micromonospora sp. WMMC415]
MTPRLSEALRRLADDLPPARVPDGLFDAARTRHRRRRSTVAGALAVLVLLLGTGYALHPVALPAPAAPRFDAPGLPNRLVAPPLRTASVRDSAPGAAAMLFGGPAVRTDWFETRMGVLAADADRYRVLDAGPVTPGFDALLSPDGRYAWVGASLLDLTSGRFTPDRTDGYPLAFAPDGERLVYADDDAFTPPNTYTTPYVGVYDREVGKDVLRVPVGTAWIPPGRTAALSPDSGELALQVRDEIWLARVADAGADGVAEPYRKLPLTGGRLGGAGAWLPDGRAVAVLDRSTCTDCPVPAYPRTWTLAARSIVDGAPQAGAAFPPLRSRTFVQLLGWRSADEAVALAGVPGPEAVDRPEDHDIAWGPYHEPGTDRVELVVLRRGATAPEVLFRTPEGITDLTVAADLAIDGAVRGSGRPDHGPLPFWLLAVGFVVVLVVALPVLTLLRRLRRRRLGWHARAAP